MGYLAIVLFCVCWSCGAFLIIRLAGLGVHLLRVLRGSFCVLCCCLVCLGLQFGVLGGFCGFMVVCLRVRLFWFCSGCVYVFCLLI